MYNIKAAVSRLDFAPKAKEMEVTDISTGHFVFTPRPGKLVSLQKLSKTIEGAGYKIEKAFIEVTGRVSTVKGKTVVKAEGSGQSFWLITDALVPDSENTPTFSGAWSEEEGRQTIRLADSKGSEGPEGRP